MILAPPGTALAKCLARRELTHPDVHMRAPARKLRWIISRSTPAGRGQVPEWLQDLEKEMGEAC
eukprot:scaffold264171_cov12-Tisochrysis_lutea.AAC.1